MTEEFYSHEFITHLLNNLGRDVESFIEICKRDALTQEVILPEQIQLELDYIDNMFQTRLEDPKA